MAEARIQRLWKLDPARGHSAWRASPGEAERVLHIHLSTPEEPQTSLCQALASLAASGEYRRVDWTALPDADRRMGVIAAAAALRPTLIFMQVQCPGVLQPDTIAEMRRVTGMSGLVIVCWCGDVGGLNGPYHVPGDRWAYELAAHCDLMLYASMSQARAHRSRGMHNAAHLHIGYDEHRYFEGRDAEYGSRFDVAFLGTNYGERHSMSLPGNDAGLRQTVVDMMRHQMGARFGLFGRGWGSAVAHLPPAQSGDVYRGSHLALNISLCSFLERYSSDRLLRILACGTPVLMKAFDGWRSLGLVHGENAIVWDSIDELMALTRAWLDPARRDELREIGRLGAQLAREHHSWGIRMQEMYPLIAAMRGASPEVARPWVIAQDMLAKLMAYHCLFEPEAELRDLLAAFAATAARAFLEVGTHKGLTSAVVALAFPDARIVTLDLPDSLCTQWNPLPRSLVGEAHRAAGIAHRIEQRFTDSSDLWRFAGQGEVYDLVFIDGDHSPDAVFRDLILAADLLPCDGGVLVAHDYTDSAEARRPGWTVGVQQAVDRFLTVRPFHKRRLAGLLVALARE